MATATGTPVKTAKLRRQPKRVPQDVFTTALGLKKTPAQITIIEKIEAGLPIKVVERVASFLKPEDVGFKYKIIPKATLARKKKSDGKLSPEEGDRVIRLTQIYAAALDVWGEEKKAREFLQRSHAMLDGKTPLEVALHTAAGARLVEDILGRLKHGTAA